MTSGLRLAQLLSLTDLNAIARQLISDFRWKLPLSEGNFRDLINVGLDEELLLNGNVKSKIKVTLFIKFSCVAAYQQTLNQEKNQSQPSITKFDSP